MPGKRHHILVMGHAADERRVLPRVFWPSWLYISPRMSIRRRHLVGPMVSYAVGTKGGGVLGCA